MHSPRQLLRLAQEFYNQREQTGQGDGVELVARGIFLVKCHVAYQTAAGVDRFQQVVTQDSIFRKAASQRALKSIDVINAFADERALAEKVLINIRDGAGVGIDPDVARVQPNEA